MGKSMHDRYDMRGATRADLRHVANNMRDADADECAALGHDRYGAYRAMLNASEASVGTVDGVPVVAYGLGVAYPFADTAHPWMLSTPDLLKHRHTFLRQSRGVVLGWRERFRTLENWVDVRNAVAVMWLKWLGFKLHVAAPHGPHGLLFHKFELRS